MSILIKGMSKPKTCDDCIVPLSKCDYLQKRADDCPIIDTGRNKSFSSFGEDIMDTLKLFFYRKANAMKDHDFTDDVAITYALTQEEAFDKLKKFYNLKIEEVEEVSFNFGGIAILTDY